MLRSSYTSPYQQRLGAIYSCMVPRQSTIDDISVVSKKQMFSGLSRMVSPFKERVGFESFCPSRMQQLGNERSLYPRFYSMNTSACITQSTNLLDLKLDKRIFYYYLHKSGGHLGLDETLEHVQETRSFHFCHLEFSFSMETRSATHSFTPII